MLFLVRMDVKLPAGMPVVDPVGGTGPAGMASVPGRPFR